MTGPGDPDMYAVLDLPDDVLKLMWTVDSTFANALRFRYESNRDLEEGIPNTSSLFNPLTTRIKFQERIYTTMGRKSRSAQRNRPKASPQ